MKKWSSWILTSILFIFFLTGCTKAAFEPSPYTADDLNQLAGVTMKTVEPRYKSDTETIHVTLANETEEELFYGVAFSIEYLDEDAWVVFPFEEEMAWREIALILQPGETNREEITMTLFEHDFEPGTYRVIKEVAGKPLTAEFEIETE